MRKILIFWAALLVAFAANSQISPDFEPCIGSGGSSGLNNLRLLVAKSNDGMNWTRTNLVLSDRSSVADGLVLPSGRLLVYYVAGCIEVSGSEQPANHIKVAVSDDSGKSWTYKDVQFNNLPSGGTLPVDPNVVLLSNGNINMLVTIDPDQTGSQKPCSYSALSTDGGFTFTLSNTSVYSVLGTDVLDPENYRFGSGNWKLWAGGIPGKNMFGQSTDEATSFTDQGEFCSATNIDNSLECYVTADVIQYDASTYKMYAFGTSSSGQVIRSLSSTDGDTWILDTTVNLTVQSSGGVEDLDVWAPTVLKLNDTSFIMVYETRIPSSASTNFASINILQGDTTISVGDTLNLIARTYFSDNSIRDITFFGTWHSSNPSVVSINNFGKLTALSNGTAYIFKTYDGINSDSVLININTTTQISNINNNLSKLIVYPNPVTDELIIEIAGNNKEVYFEIINTFGQIIFKGNIFVKTIVQTRNFSPGIYLIKLGNGKTVEFKKIIKE
ncbi:MAG: T9SS type A sorting domain-containing protein [Bacteroidales bacterium]